MNEVALNEWKKKCLKRLNCSLKTDTEVEINGDVGNLMICTKSTPLLRPRRLGPCSELEDQDEVSFEVSAF